MKAKKLLAILVSLCMLLVLVPAFTLMASADEVTLPAMKDGGTNYAQYADATSYKGHANSITWNEAEGSWSFSSASWGSYGARVCYNLTGLNATDDYVVSFDVAAGQLDNWLSDLWSLNISMAGTGGNGVIGKTPNQCFVFAGTAANTYYDAAGAKTPYTYEFLGAFGYNIKVYAQYDAANGDRDYHLFINDAYVATFADQVASDPQLTIAGMRSRAYVVSNVVAYNPNEVIDTSTYDITIGEGVNGSASSEDVLTGLSKNSEVTLTATANEGYEFVGWLKDDGTNYVSTSATFTVTVTESATYTPVFQFKIPAQGDKENLATGDTLTMDHDLGMLDYCPTYDAETDTITFPAGTNANPIASKDLAALKGKSFVAQLKHTGLGYGSSWGFRVYLDQANGDCINFAANANDTKYIAQNANAEEGIEEVSYALNYSTQSKTAVYSFVAICTDGEFTYTYYIYAGNTCIGVIEDIVSENPYIRISSNASHSAYSFSVSNVNVYAIDDVSDFCDVVVKPAVGGAASLSTIGAYGNKVLLTATPKEGYAFLYWVIGSRTYTDAELALTVKGDTVVTPVFVDTASTDYDVTFRSMDGRVIDTIKLSALLDGTVAAPAVPARYGYTDGKWDMVLENIADHTDVYPTYVKDATEYTVTVENGTANRKNVKFESKVTVTATVDNFAAWIVNGAVVSTDASYTFFVTGDITVTAVETATDASAVTSLFVGGVTNADNADNFRLTAIANTHVAEGDTFVEAGIIYALGADPKDNADAKKKVSSVTAEGQFMYSLNNAPVGAPIYVRAYLTVKTADGSISTTYSDYVAYTH